MLSIGGYLYDYYGAVILFQLSALMACFSLGLSVLACIYCSKSIGNDISKGGGSVKESEKNRRGGNSDSKYSNIPSEDEL